MGKDQGERREIEEKREKREEIEERREWHLNPLISRTSFL
jgi:hypothetical protein